MCLNYLGGLYVANLLNIYTFSSLPITYLSPVSNKNFSFESVYQAWRTINLQSIQVNP